FHCPRPAERHPRRNSRPLSRWSAGGTRPHAERCPAAMPRAAHRAWAATDRGHVRVNNEDCCACTGWSSTAGGETWTGGLPADGGWALVADGLGGHAAGEVASALAVASLALRMPGIENSADVRAALAQADATIRAHATAHPAMAGMGTTIAGLVLHDGSALVFNLGDSRIYRLSGRALDQLSIDHAVGRHQLTQCLGGLVAPRTLEPCVRAMRMRAGDRFLLCSDGLTDMLPASSIAALLAASGDPARALVSAALDAGGVDNATAVVVEMGAPA
ncbi:MAG TPA: protein phosphatase 2C domain-containing protein, partial [Allosphingosinicella sp.]